ncbi:hypothetical protein F5Y12DRAFT_720921 [Xylaria sp. FL1777]|nr:hypothetical protein F5Y12DRAFT_720921 [Xylaria sp. FL1777]
MAISNPAPKDVYVRPLPSDRITHDLARWPSPFCSQLNAALLGHPICIIYKKKTQFTVPDDRDESRKRMNREIMRAQIVDALQRANVPAGLTTSNYDEWTVVDERSLDEVGDFWRVEIVSRTLFTAEEWQDEVDLVFVALNAGWEITLTTGCAMHVHVSTGTMDEDRFTMDEVRRLLKAIALFDEAITEIMPAHRKNNEWAMSNVQGREAPADLKQLYEAVPTRTWAPVFKKFDKIKMKQMVFIEMGKRRSMSWNFSNLVAQCGTITRAYTTSNGYLSVPELASFLTIGIERLDRTCRGSLNTEAIKEDHSPPTVYTYLELQAIARKKAEKNKTGSPFVVKANSRPTTPVSQSNFPTKRSNASNN